MSIMLHDAQSKNVQMIKRDVTRALIKQKEDPNFSLGAGGIGALESELRSVALKHGAGSAEYTAVLAQHGIVKSDQSVEVLVQKTIADRVVERLSERLKTMSLEERAQARGLLRLQQQGRLDEYFASLFSGKGNAELDSELEVNNGGYEIYYLVDNQSVNGAGHAAMIMGSEEEGWHYFAFGKGATGENGATTWQDWVTTNGNMDARYFPTLNEAKIELNRYSHSIKWNVDVSHARDAFKTATGFMSSMGRISHGNVKEIYFPVGHNCDDIAVAIIESAGVELDDKLRSNMSYLNFVESGYEPTSWKTLQ